VNDEPAVKLDVDGGAATITLNRPDRLNAWNRQFGEELLAAVERARDDEAIRAVIITARAAASPPAPTSPSSAGRTR
jgi:2-(1,2-epoxy-1,2-dihydrophenyl)acetyl-CoA isomerase